MDSIQIINYPGPERWIDMEAFAAGKIRARKYRNRRIGEFFKEIDLSEKQSTGIPKILRELKQNGSPMPVFETDPDRVYLITTIKMREGFEVSVEKTTIKSDDKKTTIKSDDNGATIKTKKQQEILLSYMETGVEYKLQDFCKVLKLKESRTKTILKDLISSGQVETLGGNRDRRYTLIRSDNA